VLSKREMYDGYQVGRPPGVRTPVALRSVISGEDAISLPGDFPKRFLA